MGQLMMPGVLDVVVLEPESMSVRELRRYIEYLASNGLEAERHQLALWLRLSAPLAGLVMLFLAVPFVFGSLRNVGAGQRLLVGVMVGIGFQLLVQILSHTGQVYGIHPVVSALAPILLFSVRRCLGLAQGLTHPVGLKPDLQMAQSISSPDFVGRASARQAITPNAGNPWTRAPSRFPNTGRASRAFVCRTGSTRTPAPAPPRKPWR
jgi:hypothetical protein